MTAINELRRLLDECGAEYRSSSTGYSIDIGPQVTVYANRSDTTVDVSMRGIIPEQAIAATLGRGTCHNVGDSGDFCCSECGARMFIDTGETYTMIDSLGNIIEHPNFCPSCGRRVVEVY